MSEALPMLDGLVTFYASHHALRAEKILKRDGLVALLVPGPRDISPNCGVALQFEYREVERVRELFTRNRAQIEAIHQYRIELTEEALKKLTLS